MTAEVGRPTMITHEIPVATEAMRAGEHAPLFNAVDPGGLLPDVVIVPIAEEGARRHNTAQRLGIVHKGDEVGQFNLVQTRTRSWVNDIELAERARGPGKRLGVAAHVGLIAVLSQNGRKLESDPGGLNENSVRTWESLERRGIARRHLSDTDQHGYPRFASTAEQHMVPQELELIGLDETQPQEDNVEQMKKQREEEAWKHYTPIGSAEYEQANQERMKGGKIKVEKFGDDEHAITLVASIKVDPKTGQAVSGHESRSDAESMHDTEQAFESYLAATPPEQRLVIYESSERIFNDRDEAIVKAADSGLVQHLAAKEQIPAVSGEPTDEEAVAIMEKLGVSRVELSALRVIRGLDAHLSGEESDFIAGYINYQAASLGVEGFADYSDTERQTMVAEGRLDEVKAELNEKVIALLPTLNNLYRENLDGKDLFVVENGSVGVSPEFADMNIYLITMDRLGWEDSNRLTEVAKLNMEMRDRVIFHRILEAYNSGKSPFVVYGGSHIVTLDPVLRACVAEKTKNQTA